MSAAPAPPTTRPSGRLEKLRYIRQASRRRVRGREDVAPLAVQHVARKVDDAAHVGADRARRALAGDRPFVIGLGVIVLLAIVVVSGPLQAFLAGHDRLASATDQLAALERVTDDLEQRASDLSDPEHIEVLARSQLGYAMPGQVAYSLVPPEPAEPDQADAKDESAADQPWWRQLVEAVRR